MSIVQLLTLLRGVLKLHRSKSLIHFHIHSSLLFLLGLKMGRVTLEVKEVVFEYYSNIISCKENEPTN